jgi:hypothetical protein
MLYQNVMRTSLNTIDHPVYFYRKSTPMGVEEKPGARTTKSRDSYHFLRVRERQMKRFDLIVQRNCCLMPIHPISSPIIQDVNWGQYHSHG